MPAPHKAAGIFLRNWINSRAPSCWLQAVARCPSAILPGFITVVGERSHASRVIAIIEG
jgi:hypothetical protein